VEAFEVQTQCALYIKLKKENDDEAVEGAANIN
jgi:hypothetical protein